MAITETRFVGNALLGYPFRVDIPGFSPFWVSKCKLPGVEFEVVEISGGGMLYSIKQAGGPKIGEITLEGIMSDRSELRLFWQNWRKLVETGDILAYYKDISVTLTGPRREPNIIFDIEDAWPNKPAEFDEFDAEDKKKKATWKATLQCYNWEQRAK